MSYQVKLVRDRVGEVVGDGQTISYEPVGHRAEHVRLLCRKLLEEAGEYLLDGGIEELADLLEVIESLAVVVEGSDFEELREIQLQKRRERGGFRRGHVMFAYPAGATDHI